MDSLLKTLAAPRPTEAEIAGCYRVADREPKPQPKPTDHRAEAEQAAKAGNYEIATYHALMLIAGRI